MPTAKVVLHVYDLSRGMATQFSPMLLGKQLDGIWHTGVVVYESEYFFGGGIQVLPPSQVPAHFNLHPCRVIPLGSTEISVGAFHEYLTSITVRYTAATYDLMAHNCNTFSNEISTFLLGSGIPSYIINLPQEVLNSPFGAMLRPMLDNMQSTMAGDASSQFVPPMTSTATHFTSSTIKAAEKQNTFSTSVSEYVALEDVKVSLVQWQTEAVTSGSVSDEQKSTLMQLMQDEKVLDVSETLSWEIVLILPAKSVLQLVVMNRMIVYTTGRAFILQTGLLKGYMEDFGHGVLKKELVHPFLSVCIDMIHFHVQGQSMNITASDMEADDIDDDIITELDLLFLQDSFQHQLCTLLESSTTGILSTHALYHWILLYHPTKLMGKEKTSVEATTSIFCSLLQSLMEDKLEDRLYYRLLCLLQLGSSQPQWKTLGIDLDLPVSLTHCDVSWATTRPLLDVKQQLEQVYSSGVDRV